MNKMLGILVLLAYGILTGFAAVPVNIVPNPANPGDIGDATNAFPNMYGTNHYYWNGSAWAVLTNSEAVAITEAAVTNALGATLWKDISGNAATATLATNWSGSNAMQAQIDLAITNGQAGVVLDGLQLYSSSGNAVITNNSGVMQFDSGTGTKATYADGDWLVTELFATNGITSYGDITLSGTISGDGSGLTNLVATAISGVLTQGMASFSDFALSGTNVVISPTNGNLQSWVITEQSWAALDAADTNYTETIRLNVYGSNTVTWTSANLSNTASLGPSNSISVMLFDHSRGTNLWWGMRIR